MQPQHAKGRTLHDIIVHLFIDGDLTEASAQQVVGILDELDRDASLRARLEKLDHDRLKEAVALLARKNGHSL